MKLLLTGMLLLAPAFGQSRFAQFDRDLKSAATELRISDLRATVVESRRIVWQNATIQAPAPEEPVIAERFLRLAKRGQISLDNPAPLPPGATIREVLANTADGTPGQEVLENRGFFEALKPIVGNGPLPDAVKFATEEHDSPGWFTQEYMGERILWSYSQDARTSLLVVRIPAKRLVLIVSANSSALTEAARLQDGNIVRSSVVLPLLGEPAHEDLIDRAFIALYRGQNENSAAMVRQALDKFPELESTPDVTLLYLFSQLHLSATETSATAVIRDHPSLPTAWFYYGQYLERSKRYREAANCFEMITMHQPPWHHWTVAAAKRELTYLK